MRFARWVFLIAGIYGILFLVPGFFLEAAMRRHGAAGDNASGILSRLLRFGAGLADRIPRHRARSGEISRADRGFGVEKLAFFAACFALHFTGRLPIGGPFIGGMIDGFWMVMFAVAWLRAKPA